MKHFAPGCLLWVFLVSQYTEDPTFQRHGLMPVTVLEQATSGLAHLHSLNIGKKEIYYAEYQRRSHSFNQSRQTQTVD